MIRVVALTSGLNLPASRFRVRQFIEPLRREGVDVAEFTLARGKYPLSKSAIGCHLQNARTLLGRIPGVMASRGADVTWLERELLPGRKTLEALTGRPRVFDVDDAIWMLGTRSFSEEIASVCDGIIAGNEFIAKHFRQVGVPVWVVPTSIDTDRWVLAPKPTSQDGWTVGWIGTSSNIPYLESIESPLAAFLAGFPRARLLVVSDRRPSLAAIPPGRWRFERWSAAREVELVQAMDVGLMPLPDSDWALGKCSCKMLLYMAVGIPCVVSPVGTNAEILARGDAGIGAVAAGDWTGALERLYSEPSRATSMGRVGRSIVEIEYSVRANVARLGEIFNRLASATRGR